MSRRSRWLLGGLLVVVGVVLLGDNVGLYDFGSLWTYLPSLLILWGLWSLVEHRLRKLFWPLLLVLTGVLWQLVELGRLTEAEAWSFWPAVLVLLGLSIVLGRRNRRAVSVRGDSFELVSVTTSVDRAPGAGAHEGEATAVFGSVTADLRRDVAPPVEMDALAVFGDVTVRVPPEWDVATDTVGIFGHTTDERDDRPPRKETPDLVLSGVAVFGDVRVTT
ncbi:MAG: LiaI-LiaF-like domain-containing protein [Haloarculaceae archaeon]